MATKTRNIKKTPVKNKTPKSAPPKSKKVTTKERAYEGASKGKRLSRWQTNSLSAANEVSQGLGTLRDRSRDLRRNNPYAVRAIAAIGSNVVGKGIQVHWRKQSGRKTTVQAPQVTLWKEWAESKVCDFDGHHNLAGLQRLIMEAVVESGEVLVRRRYDYTKKFPLQYQVLEADFIDTNYSSARKDTNGNFVVQGIEFNSKGQKVAYWLLESHPGSTDFNFYSGTTKSNRVPATEVYHLFRKDRPGQVRGVPWLAPCIVRLKDFDDFEDAQLMRQKIAACFTAFVQDIPNQGLDVLTEDTTEEEDDISSRIEPAMIEKLPSGKTITFANPPSVQNYGEYTGVILRGIAVGLGITYEVLTGDYGNVNFSSGRMGWIEMFRNVDTWRDDILGTQFLDEVTKDFMTVSEILGFPFTGYTWIHISPKREMIDPTKEVPAAIMSIKGGLSTWTEEIGAKGKDVAEHFAQYAEDQALLDKLKITLMSDARVPDGPGRPLGASAGTGE